MLLNDLHNSLFILTLVISLIISVAVIAATLRYRKQKSLPRTDILWTIVPFILLFAMLISIAALWIK